MYRLWIISLSSQKIIFTRHFPHLEKSDAFIFPSTTPTEFTKSLFASLGIEMGEKEMSATSSSTFSTAFSAEADFSKLSRSSSSGSLSSLMSSNTISTTTNYRSKTPDTSDSATSFEFSMLHNYLPLIMCRIMNNPRDSGYCVSALLEEHQKLAYIDLLLLVFEKNGYLFVCCPRQPSSSGISTVNQSNNYEQYLLEEQSISLSYSTLQLFSSVFFAENRSIKHLEIFITRCMPFGSLIKDGFLLNQKNLFSKDKKSTKQNNETLLRICINEFASTSFQTFSRANSAQGEAIFGTLCIDPSSLSYEELNLAQLTLSIDNLNYFSIAKPSNCSEGNASSLSFDLRHNKLDPFNILHYRLNNTDELSKHSSQSLESAQNVNHKRLFTYLYFISQKETPRSSTTSLFSSKNCRHISLSLSFNTRFQLDLVKFDYFTIHFSLGKAKARKEVQTSDSSIIDLIIRDSIKASIGQVRSEGYKFVWFLGSKIHKSDKISLEFDLLIDEDKLVNLETMCNFRYDHKLTGKMLVAKSTNQSLGDKNEMRECQLKYPPQMIEPKLLPSRVTLLTERERPVQIAPKNSPILDLKHDYRSNVAVMVEYRMTSSDYRLFPLSHSLTTSPIK